MFKAIILHQHPDASVGGAGQHPPLLRGMEAVLGQQQPGSQGPGDRGRGMAVGRLHEPGSLLKADSPWHWTIGANQGFREMNGKNGKEMPNITDGGSGKAC